MLPPRLLTACSALPPEGAAAPADRQSQIRGPYLNGVLYPGMSVLLPRPLETGRQEGWSP